MSKSGSHEKTFLRALSILALAPARSGQVYAQLCELNERDFDELVSLADVNHVVLRSLIPLQNIATEFGDDALAARCQTRIDRERLRIVNAVQHLFLIVEALEAAGCPTTVMKSLDHWPDLGCDLDLYTTASAIQVCRVMTMQFQARIDARSWGDHLADKWNFLVPGLSESVEVHAQRLGQTGEQLAMARRFVSRRVKRSVLGLEFLVPAPEERIIVATLQRLYRHFYFRICDIVNIAALVESGAVDFVELHRAASMGGIWKGVCSLLRVVSDYTLEYRGTPVVLPSTVLADATFGSEKLYVDSQFFRVPILPHAARLYTEQVTASARRGDIAGTMRLSLFPYLATAAVISYKVTGSDKGIW